MRDQFLADDVLRLVLSLPPRIPNEHFLFAREKPCLVDKSPSLLSLALSLHSQTARELRNLNVSGSVVFMKSILFVASFILSVSAYSVTDPKHTEQPGLDKPRSVKKDEEVNEKMATLGDKLFFTDMKEKKDGLDWSTTRSGSFKALYDEMKFADKTKNIVEGINGIKPWKENDKDPTAEEEQANAEAIANMFQTMNDKMAPYIVEEIFKAKKKVDEKPTGDTQYDEFVKRLWDAAQLKVPNDLWPKDKVGEKQDPAKKDPRLAGFREAFLKARDNALAEADKLNKLIQQAPTNKTAQEKLMKQLPKDFLSDVKSMFANGQTKEALAALKATTFKEGTGWKMNLNYDGKPVTMEFPPLKPENAKDIMAQLDNEKLKKAEFVGLNHDEKAQVTPWIGKGSDIVKKEAAPTSTAAAGGAGAQPGQAGASGTAGGGDLAAASNAWKTNCAGCHSGGVSSGNAAVTRMQSTDPAKHMPKNGGNIDGATQELIRQYLDKQGRA